jgi:hypothetical protein
MLAEAEAKDITELGTPRCLVVHHPLDPHCATNVAGYRALVTDQSSVEAVDLRVIVEELERLVENDPPNQRWLRDFRTRYLDLELSAPLLDVVAPGTSDADGTG